MILGIIFTLVIIVIGASLVNRGDSESTGQAIGGTIVFFVIGIVLVFIVNSLIDGCTK